MKLAVPAVIGLAASVTAITALGFVQWRAARASIDAGFWYDSQALTLSPTDAAKINGPLTARELATIERVSRDEVVAAFTDLRVNITKSPQAFWRVSVVGTPQRAVNFRRYPFGTAGQSHVFGPLGGFGSVGFLILAHNAIAHAPPETTREEVVTAIGRGVGRAAVHEFAHQALGVDNWRNIDNRTDPGSYEYWNADRVSQYYGDLQWSTAWPVLQRKFGR